MKTIRIKTGDVVKVIAGKEKGKTGKVIQVFPRLNRVVLEGLNLSKRHLRSSRTDQKGQVVEFSMPIHASNVMPIGEAKKAVRHRVARRTPKASEKKTADTAKKEAKKS